jgi:hypothetical protein
MNQMIDEIVMSPDAFGALREVTRWSETAVERDELASRFLQLGINDPAAAIDRLVTSGCLQAYGNRIGASQAGVRVALLMEALDGADVGDICRRLRRLEGGGESYELVRSNMTDLFVRSLVDQPGVGRLYIASPWINPTERQAAMLRWVASRSSVEMSVVTRPPGTPGVNVEGVRLFASLGARIYLNSRLHSKLYIREPGSAGGPLIAFVGSQNFTRSMHEELGIRVSADTRLIQQLIGYFFDLTNWSDEYEDKP